MIFVTAQRVEAYLVSDPVQTRLRELSREGDEDLVCQKWLTSTPAKRFVFERMYWDLLERRGLRILDVGGGLTAFTRHLAAAHDYTLVDLLAHDRADVAHRFMEDAGRDFVHVTDWHDFKSQGPYDVVIANDLFPNVDQRLELFLRRFGREKTQIRVSLTYYNEPRFYKTKRVDADEYLCMLAWDGDMLARVMKGFERNIVRSASGEDAVDFTLFSDPGVSAYPNGRHVCMARLEF